MSNITQENGIITKETKNTLIIKDFNGLNIQVYGTYDNPLFKAKDIGELLEMSNIREVIKNFNNKQRCDVSLTDAIGREQKTTFLTEQGLYKILMKSRKPIAEQFQDWVCEIVEEIRKQKDIETQRLLNAKELELKIYKEKIYEEIDKTWHIYVVKTDGGTKVGKTKDVVKKRIKGLQIGNMNDIQVLLDFKTSNADLLERTVHYILERYRCNSNREFFDCNVEFIKTVVETSGKVLDTLKSCYQHITREQILNKLSENGIIINLETPQYSPPKYEDNKFIKEFIRENIILGTRHDFITKDELRQIYIKYYKAGRIVYDFNLFLIQLKNVLCTDLKIDKNNTYKFHGLKVKNIYFVSDDSD